MEQVWFPLRNDTHCEHLPMENVVFLKADGNYTHVTYFDLNGKLQCSLQSGNIGRYRHIINYGFIYLRRDVIVNRSKVTRHAKDRTVTISTGHEFLVSREKWKDVKAELNRQLLIPFSKNDHPFNKNDGSSTQ